MLASFGCIGASSGSQSNQTSLAAGQVAVSPGRMDFGSVAVGSSANQTGTLTAGTSDITVSSAAWNGSGYSVSGITFPVTVLAGQNVSFTVNFAPQTSGTATGSISFVSNATNSPSTETLSGMGTQASLHSVALSWAPSTSQVVGYNVYRAVQSVGSYSKLNSSLLNSTNYTDLTVQSGTTYSYAATSVDANNVESALSSPATAVIPSP